MSLGREAHIHIPFDEPSSGSSSLQLAAWLLTLSLPKTFTPELG
jgi:hypothetical protein